MKPSMAKRYVILATPIFKFTLRRLSAFLTRKYGDKKAREVRLLIRKTVNRELSTNPQKAPVSNRLLDIGLSDHREYRVDDHNLVFFRIDDELNTVILLAVMDARQEISKLLYEANIHV